MFGVIVAIAGITPNLFAVSVNAQSDFIITQAQHILNACFPFATYGKGNVNVTNFRVGSNGIANGTETHPEPCSDALLGVKADYDMNLSDI
jgi:hypothetical protein